MATILSLIALPETLSTVYAGNEENEQDDKRYVDELCDASEDYEANKKECDKLYNALEESGIDLIKKILEKDTTFKLKIILISAFIKSDLIFNNNILNSLSIDKILEKPIHLETLKDEVQKLVRSTPLS
jgi:hypothetical protein